MFLRVSASIEVVGNARESARAIVSEMGDNPSQFLAEVRVALHDLAATYKLPPMPTAQEKAIREHAKAIIAGVLATALGLHGLIERFAVFLARGVTRSALAKTLAAGARKCRMIGDAGRRGGAAGTVIRTEIQIGIHEYACGRIIPTITMG
ncbi:MAG: hypothetical protein JWP84_1060 [Tardiphaga sp.]|nr:hypothetical protein [Tardiphaga sp.]